MVLQKQDNRSHEELALTTHMHYVDLDADHTTTFTSNNMDVEEIEYNSNWKLRIHASEQLRGK